MVSTDLHGGKSKKILKTAKSIVKTEIDSRKRLIRENLRALVQDMGYDVFMSRTGFDRALVESWIQPSKSAVPGAENLAIIAEKTGIDINALLIGHGFDPTATNPEAERLQAEIDDQKREIDSLRIQVETLKSVLRPTQHAAQPETKDEHPRPRKPILNPPRVRVH